MNVVVRMEMPENCYECPFSVIDDTGIWCNAITNQAYGYTERDEDCPIICSLPDGHGRLVDADTIIEVMKKCAANPENAQALLCYRYAQRILEEAPTVPAAPRWVRCEDELPRKTRKFVVWVPVNNGPYPCWYEERTALWQAVEKKWYVDHNPKTWWVGEPTHWMPIEPPREE